MSVTVAKHEPLQQNGPLPATEFNDSHLTPNQKRAGVDTFRLNRRVTHSIDHTKVMYLIGQHTPEAVLRAYFEENPELLEQNEPEEIARAVGNHGQNFKKAWRNIRDEYVTY